MVEGEAANAKALWAPGRTSLVHRGTRRALSAGRGRGEGPECSAEEGPACGVDISQEAYTPSQSL